VFLRSLSLRQFRNYGRLDVEFDPRLNVFIGPNGSGKSNLMEAIAVLATGQSHRGAELRHLLQWEKEGFAVKGAFEGEDEVLLEVRQKSGRPRQTLLNNAVQKRLKDWVGRVPVVTFSPDDLSLVKGEPGGRRRLLNAVLCQVDGDYMETLQRYNKTLAERNAALRQVQDHERPPASLEPWDASLLKLGASLSLARRIFLEKFQEYARRRHAALSSGRETVRLSYRPSFLLPSGEAEEVVAANRRRLQDLREGEIALGSTLIGPHRDEVEFFLGENLARAYASQGQMRTLALAVKLAEQDFLTARLKKQPLCLFDDMLSELDPDRRENLVEALTSGTQCMVTMAAAAEWPRLMESLDGRNSCLFEVRDGKLTASAKRSF